MAAKTLASRKPQPARRNRHAATRPNGRTLYVGASHFDPSQKIVVVITGLTRPSRNRKTGKMLQVWILPANANPVRAARLKLDRAICGTCRHRPANQGTCYVRLEQAPLAVWRAWRAGAYPAIDPADVPFITWGKDVRMGAYGDPGAIPPDAIDWHALLQFARSHTGYTHAWRARPDLAAWCMASVDTIAEHWEARALDWRTFRVMANTETRIKGSEAQCPATTPAKLQCTSCKACGGNERGGGNVAVPAHGGAAVMRAFGRIAELVNQ